MRLLVVRGDLRSFTGYSKALRAHVEVLKAHYDEVVGVDIHFHPKRTGGAWNFALLADDQADERIESHAKLPGSSITILNYTTPDFFRRNPKARNVGLFYWETDRFNPEIGWREGILLMDEIWIPVRFMEKAIRNVGFVGPVRWIPWPQEIPSSREGAKPLVMAVGLPEVGSAWSIVMKLFFSLERVRRLKSIRLFCRLRDRIWSRYKRKRQLDVSSIAPRRVLALSIFQTVPRKGIFLLLSEWLKAVDQLEPGTSIVLKLSSLDPKATEFDLFLEVQDFIQRFARSQAIPPRLKSVWICAEKLSPAQLDALYESSGALLALSLGEGFGGPVVEAALRGTPVICSSGTSFDEITPESYPFKLECDESCVTLRNQLGFYPLSSKWHVIRPGGLLRAMKRLQLMSDPERERLCEDLKRHVIEYCGVDRASREARAMHP